MAQILVRNLEDQIKVRLQDRAKRHGCSMEEEAREILRDAVRSDSEPAGGLGTEMANMFRGIGLKEGEEIREWRGYPLEPMKFDE